MNTRTSILTAAAILALAIPAAAGARSVTAFQVAKQTTAAHELGQSRAVHKNHALKSGKASKHAVGKSSQPSSNPVIYLKVPGPATALSAVDPTECQDTGNNCTDQQACAYWAMNCDSISTTAVQANQPAAPASPAGDTGNTTPSSPPPSTSGYNAANCSDYYDYINTGDPSYC